LILFSISELPLSTIQLPISIAGAPLTWWIGFHLAVVCLLLIDTLLPVDRMSSKRASTRIAWIWTIILAGAAAGFAGWLPVALGRQSAFEFVGGYVIEVSLSLDNLFVFLVIFEAFGVSRARQHSALRWGIGGALVMRGLFIVAGIVLLQHFEWMTWIFGLFLLYFAWRLLHGNSPRDAVPEWTRKLNFSRGSLIPLILAVEFTDLLFAVDSVPAVFAVSRNPFIVYTSNIAAILGLRALYFALAGVLDRLRYLHYGLAAMLGFIAIKMLAARWFTVPITLSLSIMGFILVCCAIASWIYECI
jgi:tellurite resistance protein TerC